MNKIFSSRPVTLSLFLLSFATIAAAQRGVPVPVPPGSSSLFPDWVFYLIFGSIALLILVKFLEWFITRFRDFRSFSELLVLAGGIAATWLFWRSTGWGFGWCLLAGYGVAIVLTSLFIFADKQIGKRRN